MDFPARQFDVLGEIDSVPQPEMLSELTQDNFFENLQYFGAMHGIPSRVTLGVYRFFHEKGFLEPNGKDLNEHLRTLKAFLLELKMITSGIDFYKSNFLKYLTDESDSNLVMPQILDNARFLIKIFGTEFFGRHQLHSDKRQKFFRAPIEGTDCILTIKGGSGVGTFSVDFAISLAPCEKRHVTGELFRLGMDTELTPTGRGARIIRIGSGLAPRKEGYEEKMAAFDKFVRDTDITPQRALGFLAMYVAYDLGVTEMKALSLDGARNKNLSLVHSSGVKFDYTTFSRRLGFQPTDNRHWLAIPDFRGEGFYDALCTDPNLPNDKQYGLRRYECSGLERVFDAFKAMGADSMPLTICRSETREELEKALRTFRMIHGRA